MREIVKPDGTVYATVTVNEKLLSIHFTGTGYVVNMDAKIIPQLATILREAEFFKYV